VGLTHGNEIDLGYDVFLRFIRWHPDRDLNPQYDGIPDVEKYGANIRHAKPDGSECNGFVTFASDVQRRIEPNCANTWTVESWEPLTLSPSVLCTMCGHHGFVREGRWVPA
jgi:hypothetical protein